MERIDWLAEMVKRLQGESTRDTCSDGDHIMLGSLEKAEFLANLIETLYHSQGENVNVKVEYYDKHEDERRDTPPGTYSCMWYLTIE